MRVLDCITRSLPACELSATIYSGSYSGADAGTLSGRHSDERSDANPELFRKDLEKESAGWGGNTSRLLRSAAGAFSFRWVVR